MTRIPSLTLTQAKLAHMTSWAIVVFFEALAVFFPVRGWPTPLRIAIALVLAGCIVVIFYTTLSRRVEKPDERAAYNTYRANSTIYELLFFVFALYVLFGERLGMDTVTFTRDQLLLVFASFCLVHDVVFLLYERFGK